MIYLDNAATSFPKPQTVYAAVDELSRGGAGNPGRGGHQFALRSERAILEARRGLARLFSVGHPDRVILTLNATDALNMAIKGVLGPGDHAVTTDLEHNSVSRPLEALARRGDLELTRLRSNDAGIVPPEAVRRALTPRTRLVAICHASNVLGVLQDAAAIAEEAHRGGALLLLDASQSAGVVPIDLEGIGVDLCAFTGHKALLGPMGTGGLVVRQGIEIGAWREGGTGGDSSAPTQPAEYPHWLEGGTPNAVGIAGLAAGVSYVLERGVESIGRHERALGERLAHALRASPRVRIAAAPAPAGDRATRIGSSGGSSEGCESRAAVSSIGLVTFTVEGYDPQDVAALLDQRHGIAVRAGLHCAPYIHRRRGLYPQGTVRASVGPFSTEQDVDEAAAAILEIASA